nr:hypothetical protein [Bacillus methanolicus]
MDAWFTHEPLIEKITDKGLFVIGMVKQLKQRYFINGKAHTLDQLFKKAKHTMEKKELLGSIHVHLAKRLQVVFCNLEIQRFARFFPAPNWKFCKGI